MRNLFLSSFPFPPRAKLIVGVSGGSDSLGLLAILFHQLPRSRERLLVAHLNYGLRGRDSRRDEERVEKTCRNWKLPFFRLGLRDFKKKVRQRKRSLQDLGRDVRYAYFARLARSKGAWGVAVAHHREDQAETVLDRFLRGAGPKGLSGLKPFQELFPVKGGPPLKIWRPLLPYTKDEIREYLRKHSIPWKEDRTNRRNLYRRNQIRNQILPYLSRWNPNLTEVLSRIGDILALEDQYLEGLLPAVERKVSPRWKRNSFECPAAKLEKIHLALKRRFVRGVAVRLNPQARGLSFERIEEVLGLWDGRVTGPRDIGYGLSADRRHGSAFLRWNG